MTADRNDLPDLDALRDYDEPAGTEARFRALLPATPPSNPAHIELLTRIARAQGLQRQFDAAHQALDQAQALLVEGMLPARVRDLLERGRVFNSSGHRLEASPLIREARKLASAAGEDFYAVDAADMLGISEPPAE